MRSDVTRPGLIGHRPGPGGPLPAIRRRVVLGTAWIAPVALVATAAPAFAASCVSGRLGFADAGWGGITELSGTHSSAY